MGSDAELPQSLILIGLLRRCATDGNDDVEDFFSRLTHVHDVDGKIALKIGAAHVAAGCEFHSSVSCEQNAPVVLRRTDQPEKLSATGRRTAECTCRQQ